jgi:hypothetical protein
MQRKTYFGYLFKTAAHWHMRAQEMRALFRVLTRRCPIARGKARHKIGRTPLGHGLPFPSGSCRCFRELCGFGRVEGWARLLLARNLALSCSPKPGRGRQ